MSATLTMVPLAKIKARKDFNPRGDFADEQMAELVESVKQHGIITPLMLAPDGDGRFTIIAGERRYRAAKAARLREVPAQVRDADGEALTLAVAENVIRADLTPVEEARAYQRLADEHGGAAKVARWSARTSGWSQSASTSCACPRTPRSGSPPGGCRSPAPRPLSASPSASRCWPT